MGGSHGRTTLQNPRGLRKLSPGHPRHKTCASTHGGELALSFAGVSESRPFAPDRVVLKTAANKKVFAILSGHEFPDDQVTVKADPERVVELLERFEAVHPAYKLNRRHWVNISLAGDVPDELIQKLIGDSHDLVAP